MGRLKSNAKVKDATPIPFPHDGPIFYHYSNKVEDNNKNNSNDNHQRSNPSTLDKKNSSSSLDLALQLLQNSNSSSSSNYLPVIGADDGDDESSSLTSPTVKLCKTLMESTSSKDQLQALQAYRNQLLNRFKISTATTQKHPPSSSSSSSVPIQQQPPHEEQERMEWIGLYRLLLEWSFSYQTPLALRRAIHSTLSIFQKSQKSKDQGNEKQDEMNDDDDSSSSKILPLFGLVLPQQCYNIQIELIESFWTMIMVPKHSSQQQQQQQPQASSSSSSSSSSLSAWNNVLYSLELAMNYSPTVDLLRQERFVIPMINYLFQHHVEQYLESNNNNNNNNNNDHTYNSIDKTISTNRMIQEGLVVAEILKILLQPGANSNSRSSSATSTTTTNNNNFNTNTTMKTMSSSSSSSSSLSPYIIIPHLIEYQTFILQLLACPEMPIGGYIVLGITHGRLLFSSSSIIRDDDTTATKKRKKKSHSQIAIETIHALQRADKNENDDNVTHHNNVIPCDDGKDEGIHETAQVTEDYSHRLSPLARLLVVQGLAATLDWEDLLHEITTTTTNISSITVTHSPLEVCWRYSLHASRSATDPMVRLGAIKGLSTLVGRCESLQQQQQQQQQGSSIIETKDVSSTTPNIATSNPQLIQETLDVILQAWENPPNRKLSTAIPGLFGSMVGLLDDDSLKELVHSILQQPVHRKGRYIALEALLPRIGAQAIMSHKGGMESLLEGIGDRGPNAGVITDLWLKMLQHLWKEWESSAITAVPTNDDQGTNDRKEHNKTPSIPQGQGESLFTPWVEQWVPALAKALVSPGFSRRKQVAAFCLPRMVKVMKSGGDGSLEELRLRAPDAWTALLHEIQTRVPSQHELLMETATPHEESLANRTLWALLEVSRQATVHKLKSPALTTIIASSVPMSKLRLALTHSSASIRLVAFQSLQSLAQCYKNTVDSNNGIQLEGELWKFAFPYAVKTTESKEYTSSLLQCLSSFLDRLSIAESEDMENTLRAEASTLLTGVISFSTGFLIEDIVLKRGAYPGTVADKEGFCLGLLESLLAFATQDQSYSSDNSASKNGGLFNRKRRPVEVDTGVYILKALLSREVFASLFALLHSLWDNTRAMAFRALTKLVIAAQVQCISLPVEFSSEENRAATQARAVYLASSPRQREADTGARMLVFLYSSLATAEERTTYLAALVDLLENRLSSMKDQLSAILSGEYDEKAQLGKPVDGRDLPLAHGIIHATRLALEHHRVLRRHGMKVSGDLNDNLYQRMTSVFCRAIQISLSVVADMRDGEVVEGMGDDAIAGAGDVDGKSWGSGGSTPLNVNTGAIGANGTFSSINATGRAESERRFAVQRVVVGSWLLTKETCAAIAATITADGFHAPYFLVEQVGMLLISTLTSLKHAGAAFAAHNALQEIATACLSKKLINGAADLPSQWTDRLLDEISVTDKVRNSTLRRSTGYALGFLAMMRSEVASSVPSKKLCPSILASLLKLSLPSEGSVQSAFQKLGLDGANALTYNKKHQSAFYVADDQYEERCRVHALNVLRLIILDAPLAEEVGPIAGDAIIAAILGYTDRAWAVRNSSTMVFAAVMLRVIDADKNASNTDRTSSNAITVTELFRRYPPLSAFLQSVMKAELTEKATFKTVDSQSFPILLLLSRVQPIDQSGSKAAEQTKPFIPLVIETLNNRHHSIRSAAARALANLCTGDQGGSASTAALLERCFKIIAENSAKSYNEVHGTLLAIHFLITSSSTGRQLIFKSDDRVRLLLEICSWDGPMPYFPPCCMESAINTLFACFNDLASEIRAQIVAACLNIVSRLGDVDTIGSAQLGATTGAGLCKLAIPSLWGTSEDDSVFNTRLDEVSSVLESDLVDVRLAAVKTFKKCIYQHIDHLLVSESTSQQKRKAVSAIGKMLLEALHKEVKRDENPHDNIGTHPPTVRRLARCFLECASAFERTAVEGLPFFKGFLPPETKDLLWEVSILMTRREAGLDDSNFESNGETPLSASAAEIMSIEIAIDVGENRRYDSGSQQQPRLHVFVPLVTRLNDPQFSWRSRYSAAMAIESSQVLSPTNIHDNDIDPARNTLIYETLRMLQDGDPDVRKAATRVTSRLISFTDPFISPSTLPQLMLEYGYPSFSIAAKEDNTAFLLTMILENCRGIVENVAFVRDEMSHSLAGSTSSLVNVTTTRKIFEDEDPNPFQERILGNQLAVRELLKTQSTVEACGVNDELLGLCFSCLELLHDNQKGNEMVHEITRFPTIFPTLHSLMLASCVVIYVGCPDKKGVQKVAKRVVETINQNCVTRPHPEILRVLQVLSDVDLFDEKGRLSIESCCFLVK